MWGKIDNTLKKGTKTTKIATVIFKTLSYVYFLATKTAQ